jgi:hypothetical protein
VTLSVLEEASRIRIGEYRAFSPLLEPAENVLFYNQGAKG